MIGKILGNRYELLERVGEGGMSFVYKAKCRKLNRFVAVKILKDEFVNNEEVVKKFKQEATAIANLSNPNVVNVLDVGTQDDKNYIVMEYIEGRTLKDIINEKGALPYEVAINIAIKVGKALECAHKNGIIHRDVKPQNILVTDEGVVKVTDFGIAKSMDSSTIAHTNSVMGSAHYFSPEQAKGTYTDYRTDLYSLGIVLYEMVTGVVPFNGDSPVTVAVKHIQEKAIPPKNINVSIPNSLNDLILKAMEKDAVNRYQTAREMINDLEKIKNNPDIVISSKSSEEEEQFTRVMSPVNISDLNDINPINKFEEDDYEEDEEDDDYEEEEKSSFGRKEKNLEDQNRRNLNQSKNRKKKNSIPLIIIGTILVIVVGISLGYLGMKKFAENSNNISIPNVVGAKADDAKAQLESLGLKVLEVTEESDQEKGLVLNINPSPSTEVKKGSEVKLTISGGVSQVKVPNFEGMNLDSVRDTLSTIDLKLGNVTYEYNNNVARGQVITQKPYADTEVEKDSSVNVVISKGAEIKVSKVPELSGSTLDQAKSKLESLNFKVNVVKGDPAKNDEDVGKVYKQDPAPGYEVKEGTTVTITYYGDYVKPKHNASELVGMTVGQAKAWAEKNKITLNGLSPNENSKIKSVSQSEVEEGGSVNVTLEEEKPVEPEKKQDAATDKKTEGTSGNSEDKTQTTDNSSKEHEGSKKTSSNIVQPGNGKKKA